MLLWCEEEAGAYWHSLSYHITSWTQRGNGALIASIFWPLTIIRCTILGTMSSRSGPQSCPMSSLKRKWASASSGTSPIFRDQPSRLDLCLNSLLHMTFDTGRTVEARCLRKVKIIAEIPKPTFFNMERNWFLVEIHRMCAQRALSWQELVK